MNKEEETVMDDYLHKEDTAYEESGKVADNDQNQFPDSESRYISETIPKDFLQYKRLRIVPDAQTDFKGLIDKDVVLANLRDEGRPSIEEISFLSETITLFTEMFQVEKELYVVDAENKPVLKDGKIQYFTKTVFDDDFNIIKLALLNRYKIGIVSSRAVGEDREAKLDKMNILEKGISRRKEQREGILGTGIGGGGR